MRAATAARLVALLGVAVALSGCDGAEPVPPPEDGRALVVESPAFADGEAIPARHTCDGDDLSPPLAWSGVPPEAVELAVLVEDPDAPGGVFVHWVGAGIEPAAPGLAEGEAPPVAGANDFGSTGYRGPCPPPGDDPHRYVITVFAADRALELAAGASADDLRAALDGATVAHGQLVGRYGR